MVSPETADQQWGVLYEWDDDPPAPHGTALTPKPLGDGVFELTIDVGNKSKPGISGHPRFVVSKWNES